MTRKAIGRSNRVVEPFVAQAGDALKRLLALGDSREAATAALLMARILPITSQTPLFGGAMAPARLRFAGALLLALVLTPITSAAAPARPPVAPFVALLAKELLIGLTMMLIVKVLFETYGAIGGLIDEARGAGNAELFDPFNNQQQSPLGAFLIVASTTVFIAAGGHAVLLAALAGSLVAFPLDELLPASRYGVAATGEVVGGVSRLFVLTVQIAAPALAVALLVDVVLGLVNRVAQQMQATQMGYIVKGAAALGASSAALGLVFLLPVREFMRAIQAWVVAP